MTKTIFAEGLRKAKELNLNLVLLKTQHNTNAKYIAELTTIEELMAFFYRLDRCAKM